MAQNLQMSSPDIEPVKSGRSTGYNASDSKPVSKTIKLKKKTWMQKLIIISILQQWLDKLMEIIMIQIPSQTCI